MATITGFVKQLRELEAAEEKKGIYKHSELEKEFTEKVMDQIFTPAIEAAGFSWDILLKEKLTGKIGKLKPMPGWSGIPERVIFSYYNKHGLPLNNYKNVTKSVKTDILIETLKRDYEISDIQENKILMDIFKDLSETNLAGDHKRITFEGGLFSKNEDGTHCWRGNSMTTQAAICVDYLYNHNYILRDREAFTAWLNEKAEKYSKYIVDAFEDEKFDINGKFAGLKHWFIFSLKACK